MPPPPEEAGASKIPPLGALDKVPPPDLETPPRSPKIGEMSLLESAFEPEAPAEASKIEVFPPLLPLEAPNMEPSPNKEALEPVDPASAPKMEVPLPLEAEEVPNKLPEPDALSKMEVEPPLDDAAPNTELVPAPSATGLFSPGSKALSLKHAPSPSSASLSSICFVAHITLGSSS